MSNLRLLVCGDVDGKLKTLFNRVTSVNKKSGPFDSLLCVGNFFGPTFESNAEWVQFMDGTGSLDVPQIPIYILGPQNEVHKRLYTSKGIPVDEADFEAGFELMDGITFLGRKGILTGASGLRMAYLSGLEAEEGLSEFNFTQSDLSSLMLTSQSGSSVVDILMTSQWPKNVHKFMESAPEEVASVSEQGSDLVARLTNAIKPRYHLSPCPHVYFERQPYRNHTVLKEVAKPVTRFISLASIGNKSKAKWLYAFSITAAKEMPRNELIKQPDDTTECPYIGVYRNQMPEERAKEQLDAQFFYDMSYSESRGRRGGRGRGRGGHQGRGGNQQMGREGEGEGEGDMKRNKPNQPRDPCWFCLSSPEVEKHLVISIGDHAYLAMAKGGIVDDHLLILPINHIRSTLESEEEGLMAEIDKFKKILVKYFDEKQDAIPIFFERNYRSSHLQIQVVPVPKLKCNQIKETLLDLGEERGLPFNQLEEGVDLKGMLNSGIPFFYMEIPSIGIGMFIRIKAGMNFPLQLGRELLAHSRILNAPHKIDWKECALNKAEATSVASKFRTKFEPYDFTLS